MPLTTNFSEDFYDKFGHEVVEEMVNWFNQVDSEYRTQLRELNDVNYARFEAKLDRRFAEQDLRWEKRFAEQDLRWEKRFAELRGYVHTRFAEQDTKLAELAATLKAQPLIIQGHLMKWMIVFWATTILAIVGVR